MPNFANHSHQSTLFLSHIDYNAKFDELFRSLNREQRKAVEHIEGPVLAIAGPGTGKTHILAARVGYILRNTDTQAYNILCLTFTDAGVNAMRKRLLGLIGTEAHKVHISTFHSFCNSIIQENAEFFGKRDMSSLSEVERIEVVQQLLIEEEVNENPLRKSLYDAFFYQKHLYNLFQKMKSENWSKEDIYFAIDVYLDSLPEREEFRYKRNSGPNKKGDLKQNDIQEEIRKMNLLRAGVQMFDKYETVMRHIRRYDYEDMIRWVLDAFELHENLLRSYQERFQYFLIDEFQDTNGSQIELLYKLISYWDPVPNVFVVGDDDQSIFEFQGARLQNITNFYNRYAETILVTVLKENYRSSQNILDAAGHLIERNRIRLVNQLFEKKLDKKLKAKSHYADLSVHPTVREYPNPIHETTDLVRQIKSIHKQGVPLSEIAVIYSRHNQSRDLIAVLEQEKLAYNAKKRVNILNEPIIRQWLNILEWLYKEYDKPDSANDLLFEIAHYFELGIRNEELGIREKELGIRNYELGGGNEQPSQSPISNLQSPVPNLQSLFSAKGIKLHQSVTESLQAEISGVLLGLLRVLPELSLPDFVIRVFNRTGLFAKVQDHAERVWLTQVAATFRNFVQDETNKNPQATVASLLRTLENMRSNKVALSIEKVTAAADGVNLLTAHGSKGLEFSHVFIIDANQDDWQEARGGRNMFALPPTLTLSENTDTEEAFRRLFYVAMTRAKKNLQISYSTQKINGDLVLRTSFLDELLELDAVNVESVRLSEEEVFATQSLLLKENEKPKAEKLDGFYIDQVLEEFRLSVTALNRLLDCPLSFFYENILKVPVQTSDAALFGISVHHALHVLFKEMRDNEPDHIFPSEDWLIEFFKKDMEYRKGDFSKKGYKNYLDRGTQNLRQYYRQRIGTWDKNTVLEKKMPNVVWEGIPLTGTIDKAIYYEGLTTVQITDYKTARLDEKKLKAPDKKNPLGGAYYRQLVFYKLLFENSGFSDYPVTVAEIDYLTPDDWGVFPIKKVTFELDGVHLTKELIKNTWQKIKKHDFYTGCGKPDCRWCNFTRLRHTPDSFASEEIESLDDK